MNTRKIVFVINSIGSGGAERVLDTLLRNMGERRSRYEVHLVLLDDAKEWRSLPTLDGKHCLRAQGSLRLSAVRLRRLLQTLRPNLVVSLLVRANSASAYASRGRGWPLILCERMHLSSHLAGRYTGLKRFSARQIQTWAYRYADQILAVSEGVRQDLISEFKAPPEKVLTINNPYDLEALAAAKHLAPPSDLPARFIVAVGRLVEAKGFSDLIAAYKLADNAPPLIILGDGPDHDELRDQVQRLGLTDRIRLYGFTDAPFPIVARAEYFVSASRNEGFPNAIAEAMALGRPVLVTDCPSGPAELVGAMAVEAGRLVEAPYGLIAPMKDPEALAAGLHAMEDDALRTRLSTAAKLRMNDYSLERICEEYWSAFDQAMTN